MFVSWTDSLHFVSKLTLNRVINAYLIFASYLLSQLTKTARIKGLPISIAIEPTTSCNLRCPECPSGLRSFTRPTGQLTNNLYYKIINELSPTTGYLTFYFQGEPYLNPDFLKMVKYASKKRIYTATSTNAHYLDKETALKTIDSGLNRLIISIDGVDENTYQAYRIGGSLKKVLEGTKNIVTLKNEKKSSTPAIIWQFLVVAPNEHQIDEVKKMAKEFGVDKVVIKTTQIYDFEHGNRLIPYNEKYSRYKKLSNGDYVIKNNMLDKCWKMWSSSVITWDGKVIPCCFDKDAHFEFGNLQKNPFQEVWKSSPYNKFRDQLLSSRSNIEICQNCTEGTKILS